MSTIWIPKDFNSAAIDDIVDDYSDAQHERKPHGLIFLNGKEVASTLQCPHCGGHFTSQKGKLRNKCLKHDAKVCDKPACNLFCFDFYSTLEQSSVREF